MSSSGTKKKPVWIYFLISLATFLLTVVFLFFRPVQKTELGFRDWLFETRGPLSVEDSPIVMVAISQQADSEIPYKYPWPTDIYARLVENMNKAGAKVIAFDVVFDQPDENPANDSLFAHTIEKYGNVILAGNIEISESRHRREEIPLFPNSLLQQSNPNPIGFIQVNPDLDGAVRSYNFGRNRENESYYMLAIEALAKYENIDREEIGPLNNTTESDYFKLGRHNIRRDYLNSFLINYYGPEGTFPIYSLELIIDDSTFATVMEEEAFEINSFDEPGFKDIFKDKIVIVGSTMSLLKDFFPTPFAETPLPRPGYEIHAHAMQTILDDAYLSRQKTGSILLMLFLMCFFMVFINRQWGLRWGIGSSVLVVIGYIIIAVLTFIHAHIFLNITGVVIAILLAQAGTYTYEYVGVAKERRRIKGMFSTYISPTLVNQMIESGEEPKLGGEEIFMTAFFSDIVSFSSFSEKLEPQQLVTLINEYLTVMSDIINDQKGTLDKYIGDAIVAFFGAPVHIDDHAYRACISSQLMQKKLKELRAKWEQDGWPDIVAGMQNRIGLNTGLMVTGNMGSERRFNYTMMGDNVNLAARCESGAKQYGVFTMVTEATKLEAEKFGDDCVFRLLDNIVVKGRTKPVKVFEIADLRSEASPSLFECIGYYEEGMQNYFKQEWDEAIMLFNKSLMLEYYPENPSKIFIERCRLMKLNPPEKDWDGVFVMTSK